MLGHGYTNHFAAHHGVLRSVWTRHGGVAVDAAGDAFFVVFTDARAAAAEADETQAKLGRGRPLP